MHYSTAFLLHFSGMILVGDICLRTLRSFLLSRSGRLEPKCLLKPLTKEPFRETISLMVGLRE